VVVLPLVPVIISFFLHLSLSTLSISGLIDRATFPGSAVAFMPTIFKPNIVNLPATIDGVRSII
jgi:hypothetical protein